MSSRIALCLQVGEDAPVIDGPPSVDSSGRSWVGSPFSRAVALVVVGGLPMGCSDSSGMIPDASPSSSSQDATSRDSGGDLDANRIEVTVIVVRNRVPISGIDVVFHAEDGVPVHSAATDRSGEARFAPAAGGMVTVASADGQFVTLFTVVGVEPGDVIGIDIGEGDFAPLGTASVQLPGSAAGASFYRVGLGCNDGAGNNPDSAIDVALFANCLGTDSAFDVLGLAMEGSEVKAVSFATNVPVAAMTTAVALPAWTAGFGIFQVVPQNGTLGQILDFRGGAVVDGVLFETPIRFAEGAVRFAVIPEFSHTTEYQLFRRVDPNHQPGGPDSRVFYGRRLPPNETADVVDFAADFLAPVTAASVDASDHARPVFRWATTATSDESDGVLIRTQWLGTGQSGQWGIMAPPGSTAVVAPMLPDSLAGFRPNAAVATPVVVVAESDALDDYRAFRAVGSALLRGPRFLQSSPHVLRGSIYLPMAF